MFRFHILLIDILIKVKFSINHIIIDKKKMATTLKKILFLIF